MKKASFILVMILMAGFNLSAQNLIDTNTGLIKNYFLNQEINNFQTRENLVSLKNTDVYVFQLGNENNAIISINEESKQYLKQEGNNNNFEYFTYYSNVDSFVQTTQNGSNNDIQIYGENSISKNLKIRQNTNNQTIIINNY